MNWRSISLFVGVASLVGAVASFTYGGPNWLCVDARRVRHGIHRSSASRPSNSSSSSRSPNCGRRSSSRCCSWPSTGSATTSRCRWSTRQKLAEKMQQAQSGRARAGARVRLAVLRRQPEHGVHLLARHHAVHLRVDHHSAARERRDAVAGAAAQGRRERAEEAQRDHALPHRPDLHDPGADGRATG